MKNRISKRILAGILTFGMAASLMPATAFAAQTVTTTPGREELQVEYFNSTLYNWNESAANAATAKIDTGVSTTVGKVASTGSFYTATVWTITRNHDGTYYIGTDEGYLTWTTSTNAGDAQLTSTPVPLRLEAAAGYTNGVTISQSSGDYPNLNYYNADQCGGWNGGDSDPGNVFYIATGRVTDTPDRWDDENTVSISYIESGKEYYIVSYRGLTSSNSQYLNYTSAESSVYSGFYFTEAENKQDVPFSKWTSGADEDGVAKQNYYIYSGLAERNLKDSSNAPFSNENVKAANLFAQTSNAYTDVYNNVRVPFVYDEETGYYELNSDKWAVYFDNGDAGSNGTMSIADKPVSFTTGGVRDPMCGFQPFEDVSSNTQSAYYGTAADIDDMTGDRGSYTLSDNNPTYGFGMVTSIDFQMTDDGRDENGEPIEFTFSGDDDVWVYVDGVLALDIGGTHDAITGTIDFSTGNVTLSAEKYGRIGDKAVDPDMSEYGSLEATLSQGNLYESLGTTLTGFASDGTHTLTIYYMDRGRGATNCLIRFNLPQRDTVSVTKEITQSKTPNGEVDNLTEEEQARMDGVDFGFTLYKDGTPVANTTYYITTDGESETTTASTDFRGHFTLRNGQTATFLGAIEGSTYYVVEDTLSSSAYTTPEYSYTSNAYNTELVEAESGFQSMQVSAEGSATAADSINFVCKNYMNAQLPNPSIDPADDLIVIDYGLPISISADKIIENDTRRGDSFEITEITSKGEYGTAVLSEDHKTITYTLEKQLNGIEELTYTAVATSGGDNVSDPDTGTIKIIPATSMYYEEDFGSTTNTENEISGGMIQYSGQTEAEIVKWVKQGTAVGGNQETGYVTDDNDSTYGTDTLYLNHSGDSYGTSRYANADGAAGAAFEYDFTGTGTAIYGRTSLNTGYIEVRITDQEGNVADRQFINTRIIGNIADKQELYNIPIYNNDAFDYGEYHVRVYLYKQGTPVNGYTDSEGNFVEGSDRSGAEFYLDGVRVYEPLKGNETAESAYAADGEANVSVINIREKVVADAEEGYGGEGIFTVTDDYGEDMFGDIMDLEGYISYGPNEELYLNGDGYNVDFSLVNWNSQFYDLYIGMKCPTGESATVNISGQKITVNNSVDCYYNISDFVVVENGVGTVTIEGVGGLISLTNIKVTGDYEFDLGYANDIEMYGVDEQTLYFVPSNYSLNNEDSGEEEAVFVPETIKTTCSYGSKNMKATVTVLTSQDVSRVEINGTEVAAKLVNGRYKFTYSEKKVAAGKVYNIVAYNADGVASAAYTVTAE